MGITLNKLSEEDPTFTMHTDDETQQVIIAGMGELHLEVLVDRMRREFSVEVNTGKPQVAYKETIKIIKRRIYQASIVKRNPCFFLISAGFIFLVF